MVCSDKEYDPQIPEEDSRISFDVFVLVSERTLPSNVPQLQVMKSAITIIINLNENSHLTSSLLSPWHRLMIIYIWLPKLLETSLRAVLMQQGYISQVLKNYTDHACDGEYISLRCPHRTTISIQSSFYGRIVPSHQMCPSRYPHSYATLIKEDVDCSVGTSLQARQQLSLLVLHSSALSSATQHGNNDIPLSLKMLDECQDRRSCQFLVNSRLFGADPCPGTGKYLLVWYKCRPKFQGDEEQYIMLKQKATHFPNGRDCFPKGGNFNDACLTRNNEYKSKVACEDDKLRLSCKKSMVIAIYSAVFGRTQGGSLECPYQNLGMPMIGVGESVTAYKSKLSQQENISLHVSTALRYGEGCSVTAFDPKHLRGADRTNTAVTQTLWQHPVPIWVFVAEMLLCYGLLAFHHAGDDMAGTLALWDEQHTGEGIGLWLSFLRCPPGSRGHLHIGPWAACGKNPLPSALQHANLLTHSGVHDPCSGKLASSAQCLCRLHVDVSGESDHEVNKRTDVLGHLAHAQLCCTISHTSQNKVSTSGDPSVMTAALEEALISTTASKSYHSAKIKLFGNIISNPDRFCNQKQQYCQSATALQLMIKRCHGKRSCSIYASTYEFGDPCYPGIRKHLNVIYTCGNGEKQLLLRHKSSHPKVDA
ncbi:Uncharacterized protein C21orf63-like protein [Anas platyrhynchos]|uniref:Uncharacterized protein C21orf63-like protein n=1 Tax=Anas platyrhynchos TaxID=8839 RepID=R0M0G3_ANAPL|nr:Uncharacterized protein C21orf63-like protein [Anas platyrhynchos]